MPPASYLKWQAAIFKVQSISLSFFSPPQREYFCQQQCSVHGFLFVCLVVVVVFVLKGKTWTMQFYWKLNAYSYPVPVPTQQNLTQNIQVIAQAVLGYSMFNTRTALKLLVELPPHQSQKIRNTELQKKRPVLHRI